MIEILGWVAAFTAVGWITARSRAARRWDSFAHAHDEWAEPE